MYRLEVAYDHNFTDIAHSIDTPATRFIDTVAWPAASYWWRVKVIAPFDGSYSNVRSFTRRWMGPDGSGNRQIARPDAVKVEDFSADPGIQVPGNALKISWEPVAEASHYEVQFDGNSDKVCTTPHSVLTPYLSGSLGSQTGSKCNPELGAGLHWIRVRAVDETVGDGKGKIYSLWSDEARTVDSAVPEPVVFTIGPDLSGPDAQQPAVLTSPRNGKVFLDVPTFEWEPVSWATEYELVLARDQDFTNVIGTFRTKNTRLVPLQRLPEKGLITKQEARVLSLAKLHLAADSVVWDIGAGSGAVGLEAAALVPLGHVWAIEKNAGDASNARANAVRFQASNYTLVEGRAPAHLDGWPDPDAVFIGGSGGELAELIERILGRLKPGGRLVMNFVTLENLATATRALAAAGVPWDLVQLQASRSQPILDMHRLAAQNPVWILTARKEEQ